MHGERTMPKEQIIETAPPTRVKEVQSLTHLLRHIRPDIAKVSVAAAMAIDVAILVLEQRRDCRK
jgi:hypothetical protein